jgi:D-alanyl-D-alanine carboxypeptidase/D-alanyl-D-alanine-endopeptidase (penicillin-binding protein 4)
VLNKWSKTRIAAIAALSAALVLPTIPAFALKLPHTFIKLAASPLLAKPGIVLIDPETDQMLYSQEPDVLRAPASVLKLVSMTTAIHTLGADTTFTTSISATDKPDTFVLLGQSDPWLTASDFEAKKYHRAYSPSLINAVLAAHPDLKSMTLDFSGVYSLDAQALQKFFAGRVNITLNPIASPSSAQSEAVAKIAEITSPPLKDIAQFTLLWSDNVLADRLARTAAVKLGFGGEAAGIAQAFTKTLDEFGVEHTGLAIYDGNGLSKQTRISARTIGELLVKIQATPELNIISEGLPLAGKTGTLQTRFVTDAPKAVGLVQAKTGWINGTVSLAGYVNVRDKKYVFAVIANRIHPSEYYRQLARQTIDKMLATIALPALKKA